MNQIKIYPAEINDGIAELVKTQASVAYCSPANVHKGLWTTPSEVLVTKNEDIIERVVAENKDQIDLFYLESVLVSTGWNKNDDVFLADATWEARNTPEDKQFNYMHDENDIIGHITGSYVLSKDGKRVDDAEFPPEEFDIITQAVLYNSWTNPENRERMESIIAEIEQGKWYVSMECLFAGFDYALMDEKGRAKLLPRNEASAFLTKHLRSYGGTGEYQGYKVGRALRQISFSGKGLVSKPANPRSIILSQKSLAFNINNEISDFSIGENKMSDTTALEKQLADVRAELASAKEENKVIKAQIEEAKDKEFAAKISDLENTVAEKEQSVAEMEETIKSTQARIAELEDALAKSSEQLSAAMKNMEDMKKKELMAKRKASLIDAGFENDEAEASLVAYESLADEAFESIVAAWKGKMSKMKKEETEAMKMKEDKAVKKPMAEEVEAPTFENVETSEASLVEATVTNEIETTRASIAGWLEGVLATNKKK
jgi:uncharacterized coiled-coil protein SlyX